MVLLVQAKSTRHRRKLGYSKRITEMYDKKIYFLDPRFHGEDMIGLLLSDNDILEVWEQISIYTV